MATNKTTKKKTAKRKPSPPRAKVAAVAAEIVDQTIALLLALESHNEVTKALTSDKMGLTAKAAEAAIAEAQRRLALAAGFDRTRELGRAIARLNNLYRRSIQIQDCKTALGVQRELNRLLDLGAPAPIGAGAAAADPAHPDPPDDAGRAAAHLRRAYPAFQDLPLDELARMAAAELIDTRNAPPL